MKMVGASTPINTSNTRENGSHATGEPATNSLGKSGTQNARETPARTHTPNAKSRSVCRSRRNATHLQL
jgi:hypothetical protein